MKFFVPGAESQEQAEKIYAGIKDSVRKSTGYSIATRRIFRIEYRHGGITQEAEVGKPSSANGEEVMAIFQSDLYLVCTPTRGVISGSPLLVEQNEVLQAVDFEPSGDAAD